MQFPWWISRFMEGDDSIHWSPELGGGNLLEAGCYCVNAIRYTSGAEPTTIENAAATGIIKGQAETGIEYVLKHIPASSGTLLTILNLFGLIRATLKMSNGVVGHMYSNFRGSGMENSLKVVGTKGELFTNNFIVPHFWHYLNITTRADEAPTSKSQMRSEKHYGNGWSSYRCQLEAFVSAVRKNTPFPTNATDAVKTMRVIDMIFDAAGLPRRGK